MELKKREIEVGGVTFVWCASYKSPHTTRPCKAIQGWTCSHPLFDRMTWESSLKGARETIEKSYGAWQRGLINCNEYFKKRAIKTWGMNSLIEAENLKQEKIYVMLEERRKRQEQDEKVRKAAPEFLEALRTIAESKNMMAEDIRKYAEKVIAEFV